jgi:2-iminobutanoate/2-iminopropanoate deaminase
MSDPVKCFEEFANAPKAVGPYSPATRVGDTFYLSGQLGLNPSTGQLVGSDIRSQTEQVLANIKSVLAGLGLSFKNVAKTTIFLTNLADFQTVNAIYSEALQGHKPARSTIQVSALPLGAIVEIEMIAVAAAKS